MHPWWHTVAALPWLWLSPVAAAAPSCGDFLEALKLKPAQLEYIECQPGHLAQVRALIASYRVTGAQAPAVERYFSRRTGMARLRFLCCGWEPAAHRLGRVSKPSERDYEIAMTSEETGIARRAQWAQIPWFYVTVTLPLEEP